MSDPAPPSDPVADRLAIADVLARYCRGIDRCDADELRRVFAPDAVIDYGDGPSLRDAAIDQLLPALRTMRLTHHSITNPLIEIDGDRARAETYCTALHILGPPGEEIELVVGGRYLDAFARRSRTWQIVERLYVMDWNRQQPATMQTSGGLFDTLLRRGARWPDDPLYRWQKARFIRSR